MEQSKLKPALISGVIFGVLSLIPFVNMFNCCCGWLLVCGAVAVKMYKDNSPNAIRTSEGAVVGAMSGAVAGTIIQMVGMIYNFFNLRNMPTGEIKEVFRKALEKQPNVDPRMVETIMQYAEIVINNWPVFLFLGMLVGIVIMTIFGSLGGVIGVSLFKGKSSPPNTPPYDYGQSFGEGPKSSYPGK